MKFDDLTLTVSAASVVFNPYDRGANGAFVYRMAGQTLHAPRLVVSTTTNDSASDKYVVQLNKPRVCPAPEGSCESPTSLGTDLCKVELRFLATTSPAARLDDIDTVIAALQEFRTSISVREKLYA